MPGDLCMLAMKLIAGTVSLWKAVPNLQEMRMQGEDRSSLSSVDCQLG